jgi:hypothetical protein
MLGHFNALYNIVYLFPFLKIVQFGWMIFLDLIREIITGEAKCQIF